VFRVVIKVLLHNAAQLYTCEAYFAFTFSTTNDDDYTTTGKDIPVQSNTD